MSDGATPASANAAAPERAERVGRREVGHLARHRRAGRLAAAEHVHRRAREVARPLGRGDDDRAAGVGGHAAHRTGERVRDDGRVEHLVDGDRIAAQRARVARRPVALRDDDVGERVASRPRSRRKRSAPRVSSVIGPTVPYGSSNWPCHAPGPGSTSGPPSPERPLSPWAIEHHLALAGLDGRDRVAEVHEVGAAADHGGVDPTGLDAQRVRDERGQVRAEPAAGDAVDVGGREPAVGERAAGGVGGEAERRQRDGADLLGLGGADDGDAGGAAHVEPRPEQRQRHLAERLERHLQREIEGELLGIGRDVDEVAQEAGALFELHLGDHVRRFEAGCGAVGDHVAVERAAAGRAHDLDVVARARRAERLRREVGASTRAAPLEPELAGGGAVPEVLRLGGGSGKWAWRAHGGEGIRDGAAVAAGSEGG